MLSFHLPRVAILGNQVSDTLNGLALLIVALSFLMLSLFAGRRLTHIGADVKGMKFSVDTEVKPALGLPPTKPSEVEGKVPGGEAPPLGSQGPITGEIPLMKRLEAVEEAVKPLPHLTAQLETFIKQDVQWRAALITQLGIKIPHIPERSPEGRQ